jgi:hypothetical protein
MGPGAVPRGGQGDALIIGCRAAIMPMSSPEEWGVRNARFQVGMAQAACEGTAQSWAAAASTATLLQQVLGLR